MNRRYDYRIVILAAAWVCVLTLVAEALLR
jgi:hypothetical protein